MAVAVENVDSKCENVNMISSKSFPDNIDGSRSGQCKTTGENPYLVPFFNFYFFLYMVPFKMEMDSGTGHYVLKKYKLHRIICMLSHGLVMISMIVVLFTSAFKMKGDSSLLIVDILEFLSNFAGTILALLAFHMFWRKELYLRDIINSTIISWDFKPPREMKIIRLIVYIITITLIVVLMIITFFLITGKGHYLNENTNVTLSQENESHKGDHLNNSSHIGEAIFYFISIAIDIYVSTISSLIQGMFLMITLSLRQIGKVFEIELEKTLSQTPSPNGLPDKEGSVRQGIAIYKRLKATTESIKKLFGAQLLAFCLSTVTYYAEAPHVLSGKRGNAEKAVLGYFMLSTVTWFIAAEFHYNIKETLSQWLEIHTDSDNLSTSLRLRLMGISGEINSDPVALSSKYFTVTFGFLSSLFSIVATYGIIVFQLHHGDQEKLPIIIPSADHSSFRN